jgi:hypothetical protein
MRMSSAHEPSPVNWRMNAMIARFVGIVAIALGFVLGIHSFEQPTSHWLQTALALLVTGMLAQGYALYCSVKRMQELQNPPK